MSGEIDGKSDTDKNNEQLNLKVIGQDGETVQFKIKRSTPFRKLINAYCDRSRLSATTVRFMFDGNRINDTDTPKSMDMEEGDTIEVFTQQSGGDLEETNSNKNFVSSSFSKSTTFNKYLPNNNVIQQKQTQKHLTRSKYRRKKSDEIL